MKKLLEMITEAVDISRFKTSKFKRKSTGEGNIEDFKSSASALKSLGMNLVDKVEVSSMAEYGDRRGYYYEISNVLDRLKDDYKYFGWAEVSVYGRPVIAFYAK